MVRVSAFAIVGSHDAGDGLLDAVDLAVRVDDRIVALGVRTAAYMTAGSDPNRAWGTYEPIAVNRVPADTKYWDLRSVLWLGPQPHRCVVWSEALGFRADAFHVLLSPALSAPLIEGPDGRGLPSFHGLGRDEPPADTFTRLRPPSEFAEPG